MSEVTAPVETPDPFKGEETTFEEYSNYRKDGTLPERFQSETEPAVKPEIKPDETPAPKEGETVEGKEPSKEAEQEKKEAERDEHGKFRKKVEFSPEQQDLLNREIAKAKRKFDRELQEHLAKTSEPQASRQPKMADTANADGPPKRPELPKLSEYKGTIEEFEKETADYPARLQAFLDAERQSNERVSTIVKRLNDSEAKAKKSHPDYVDAFQALADDIKSKEEPILPNHVLAAIQGESDDPHELTYYLAKNREEFRRFATLAPEQTLREVLKLDFKLSAKPPAPDKEPAPPKPKPPAPVGARATATGFDVNDESTDADTWARQRNEQLAKRRGR